MDKVTATLTVSGADGYGVGWGVGWGVYWGVGADRGGDVGAGHVHKSQISVGPQVNFSIAAASAKLTSK